MSLYDLAIPQFIKMLRNLDACIDLGVAHATAKKFEPSVLLNARLAPDQFHFIRQVQSSCDTAKLAGARLTGKEAPKHGDTEQTVDELKKRIAETVAYLEGLSAKDFENADSRAITLPWMPGKSLAAKDYVLQFAIPNFYFHVTTAYSILRHNGVDVGKRHYIGDLPFRDA